MIDIYDSSCAPYAIVAKEENDQFPTDRFLTQVHLFVYIAVCSQHYWQTAKAVPLSNVEKTKPCLNRSGIIYRTTNAINLGRCSLYRQEPELTKEDGI